jgi:hypothetical protein
MPKTHPHEEASYRVIPFGDAGFAVEVSIPGSNPTKVSPFPSKDDAEAWIAEHQRRVQSQSQSGRWFRSSGGPRAPRS